MTHNLHAREKIKESRYLIFNTLQIAHGNKVQKKDNWKRAEKNWSQKCNFTQSQQAFYDRSEWINAQKLHTQTSCMIRASFYGSG